jgi:hypothetical protein
MEKEKIMEEVKEVEKNEKAKKKMFVVKGMKELKESKKKEIVGEIVDGDNVSIERPGGTKIVSRIFLTYGEIQTIKKLALKGFKTKFKDGKVSQDIDLSALSEFRPDTDKGVQLLLTAIKSIDGNEKVTKEDIISITDTEIIENLLEILLEENGMAEKKADEEKND